MAAKCSAPFRGHKPDSKEGRECPLHGPRIVGVGQPSREQAASLLAASASPHRVASGEFDPEQYELVAVWDVGTQRKAFEKAFGDAAWATDIPHGDRCSHCGAHLKYAAVMRHSSGEHITVGETCLGDRFAGSAAEFEKVRELGKQRVRELENSLMRMDAEQRARAYETDDELRPLQKRIEKKAVLRDRMFAENPVVAATTYPEMFADEPQLHSLALSLDGALDRYPTLTSGQIGYFESLYVSSLRVAEAEAAEKARKAEAVAQGFAAPRGNDIEVTGVVSSVKFEPNDFDPRGGSTKKMRVSLPGGCGVYVTVPASISEVQTGDRVQFTANFVPPTDDDPLFAYGKRPRRAAILEDD